MVEVVLTDEAMGWLESLEGSDRAAVARGINLLEQFGVHLGHPHTSSLNGSKYAMRELRIQGRPLRAFYVFDVTRDCVVLCGGDKSGTSEKRFYVTEIARAEKIWEEYQREQGR